MNLDSTTLILASLTMAAVACGAGPSAPEGAGGASTEATVGAVGPGTTTGSGKFPYLDVGRNFFIDKTYPALIKDCRGCHAEGQLEGPIFLLGEADTAYEFIHIYNEGALVAVPEENLLLHKGQHEGPDIFGQTRANVAQWLALEYPGRLTPPPKQTAFQALVNFGQCLSKNGFLEYSELDQLFNVPTDAVPGAACTCATCHNKDDAAAVGGSLILDPDADLTFAGLQSFPGMMALAQGKVGATGIFDMLIPSQRIALKGKELNIKGPDETACLCDPDHRLDPVQDFGIYCHPTYTLNQDFIDLIDDYANDAINRSRTLQCNPDNTK
jgi:hypothetical protein